MSAALTTIHYGPEETGGWAHPGKLVGALVLGVEGRACNDPFTMGEGLPNFATI